MTNDEARRLIATGIEKSGIFSDFPEPIEVGKTPMIGCDERARWNIFDATGYLIAYAKVDQYDGLPSFTPIAKAPARKFTM